MNKADSPLNNAMDGKYPLEFFEGQQDKPTGFVSPQLLQTGTLRGTQRIVNQDGSYITLGVIPNSNGEFGIAFFDKNNTIQAKITALTDYKYNPSTGKNYLQTGKLPDGSYGTAWATDGYNVSDGIS